MKRVGPAGRRVRECAAEVVRAARGEQCLPGAKLVDTVSELTLVAIRTAATSYPRAAELSLQGTRGGARMGLGWQEDGGTGTLAGAVGWPRVHNRRSGATLCPGTDARSRGTQGTLDAAGRIGAAAGSGTLYLAGSLARGALPPLLRLPPRTIGAVEPAFAVTQGPTARTDCSATASFEFVR